MAALYFCLLIIPTLFLIYHIASFSLRNSPNRNAAGFFRMNTMSIQVPDVAVDISASTLTFKIVVSPEVISSFHKVPFLSILCGLG